MEDQNKKSIWYSKWATNVEIDKTKDGTNVYSRGKTSIPVLAIIGVGAVIGIIISCWRFFKDIDWIPAILTTLWFIPTMWAVESYAIAHAHWIYNLKRITGIMLFGVPMEEVLIFYIFPPIFVIMFFEVLKRKFDK